MHLTYFELYVKESLRAKSSVAVTILIVSSIQEYVLHTHARRGGAVAMACNFALRVLRYRSRLVWCGAVIRARHSTCTSTSTQK